MIQNLGNKMGKIQATFNKDLEEIKSKQTMMNNTINEIKNSLEGGFPGGAVVKICLPMQGTWVQALVQEDSTCRGATKPVGHNYGACTVEPTHHNY